MALKDLSGFLKKTAKQTTETVKATADAANEKLKEAVKDGKIPEINIKDIKIPDKITEVLNRSGNDKTEHESAPVNVVVSTLSAMKIFYYLMAADGCIHDTEMERFQEICQELDPRFEEVEVGIRAVCEKQLDKVIDEEDYDEVIKDGVEEALLSSVSSDDSFITPKLLLWNLLTVAYSDGSYGESERNLLKYIVRKLDVDKAVFLEMEHSYQTLIDLDRELEWIKNTSRPYLTIEAMVNEINDRKNVIFGSVKDLITL